MRKPECPFCKSEKVVEIVYGFPSEELFEAADRGEKTQDSKVSLMVFEKT